MQRSQDIVAKALIGPVRFVLFDAVGTLLRVTPSVAEIYLAVGQQFGSQRTREEIQQRFGDAFARHHDGGPTDELREQARWRAIVREVLDDCPDANAAFHDLWERFAKPSHWSLFEDVAETWTALEERGLILGIASNFDQRLIKLCAAIAPLHRARHIFVSSEVGFPKPNPEFFRRIASRLQAIPNEILLVGDSLVHDVEGARSAGWQVVHLDRSAPTSDASAIPSLRQLLRLLKR